MTFDLRAYLTERRELVDRELDARLPDAAARPKVLHEAMRYSVMAGGKRLRPILCMAAAEAVGGTHESALTPGLAVEILHTYTLIHDDLPCMDDDDLRRGKPTLHKVHGEANAILAGDALLTLAFEWLAPLTVPAPYAPGQLVVELAAAAGSHGVIAGQVEDLAAESAKASGELLSYIHMNKTATLIRAAARMGAIAGGASEAELDALSEYAVCIGLAFQVIDDVLDETSTTETLGKPAGSDAGQGKLTYVSVHGLDASRNRATELIEQALSAIKCLQGNTFALADMARYITARRS
jgi:geranylgeranyl diphosphate synthase type II